MNESALAGRAAAAEAELADLKGRVAAAQALANMGDYDWDIANDVNRWSDQLYRIYGLEPQSINMSYDEFLSRIHPDDRARIEQIHREAYASGGPYQMIERIIRPDGEVRHLSSNGEVICDESGTPVRMRGTCVDVTEQVLAEQSQSTLRENELWRRHALEINDNVVQSLTAAIGAFEGGNTPEAVAQLKKTLGAARHIMNDWMRPGEALKPGDLVRTVASSTDVIAPAPVEPEADLRPRVVIVDDNGDLRAMLRAQLEFDGRYRVVGEASDGGEAIAVARDSRPDVVLLDLAMPRMDGVQALPRLLEAVSGVKVIALSGFETASVEPTVMAAGAAAFIEKGFQMGVADVIAGVLGEVEPSLAGH